MQTTIWIIAALTVAALAVTTIRAARRHHRQLVPATPLTISVSEPTVDTLESPRYAAEARAAQASIGLAAGRTLRRA